MVFFTLDYITSLHATDSLVRSIFIFVMLLIGLIFSLLYLRNKLNTRMRDVALGSLVFSLVLLGIQTEQYLQLSQRMSQTERMSGFIEGVATDQGVPEEEVLVNSTALKDGIIVRLWDEDYLVHLGDDNNSYTLEETHIIDHHVYVNGKH